MKKIITFIIILALTASLIPYAAFADQSAALSADVYVNIINGTPALAMEKITVTDTDGDEKLTISDALYCAHEAKFDGGAAAGYATEVTQWGLSMTKLWGVANGGSYGYYLNNASAWSLYDEVKASDTVTAFIYTDTVGFSDTYSYFDKSVANVSHSEGSIELTLSYVSGYDANYAPVISPLSDAAITVDGKTTEYKTDAAGKVTVSLSEPGAHVLSATSDTVKLVAPVCVVNISAKPADVYVNIINGTPAIAMEKITVTDVDGDGKLTISEALYCAHEAKFDGGAAAGYATEVTQWGLSMTKLWGVANGGSYGYYLNNASPMSLYDEVKASDTVTAFIYTDTTYFSDTYSYFDKGILTQKAGDEITLTLSYLVYDTEAGAMVTKPAEGATVTINGEASKHTTDTEGKVTIKLSDAGTFLISADSSMNLVPAVCVVTVEAAPSVPTTPPAEDPVDEPQSYGWMVAICAAVVIDALAVALAISKKNSAASEAKKNDESQDENEPNDKDDSQN
ncbi:MAG: hypothetical protein IJY04_05395 [Clostridia bacterium]|nr:hypothetical protein [Clostridia bacterium]